MSKTSSSQMATNFSSSKTTSTNFSSSKTSSYSTKVTSSYKVTSSSSTKKRFSITKILGIENVKLPPAKIDICPSLSNYQVHILKSTWNKVRTKMIAKDISGCFQAIERISSAASMSFNSVPKAPDDGSKLWQPKVIVDHTNNFIGLLDRIISNESGMEEELRRIGSAHVHLQEKYGLSVSEFEKFGEITAERFLLKDGIRQNNEATQTKFVKFLKKKNLAMPGVSLCQRLSIISKLDSNRR